jgi:hypothetical protein
LQALPLEQEKKDKPKFEIKFKLPKFKFNLKLPTFKK